MHTVQLKIDNSIYHNVMFLLNNLKLKGLEIQTDKEELDYNKNEIPYMDAEETKEIEKILKNPKCHKISHSKIISFEL